MDNVTLVPASEEKGTQEPVTVTIPNEQAPGNEQQNNSSADAQKQNESQPSSTATNEPKPVQRNENAEIAKMSILESENAKLKKEIEAKRDYDALKKRASDFEALNKFYASDKEAYEALRKGWIKQGLGDPGDYDTVYPQAQQQFNNGIQNEPMQQATPPIQEVVQAAVGQMEMRRDVDKWLDENEDLDYRNLDSNSIDYQQREAKAVSIARAASALRNVNPNLTYKEALDKAMRLDDDYYKRHLEQEKEIAKQVGRANTFAKAGGTTGAIGGDSSGGEARSITVNLSDEERKLYNRYIQQGRKDVAANYLKHIHERSR